MNIDPNTLNTLTSITLNVASNGLTSLLVFSGHKMKELAVGKDFLLILMKYLVRYFVYILIG